jgi:hypothetical protein
LTDLSGNGRHITTGVTKPLYRSSGVKSKPSFDFAGNRSISQTITAFTGSEIAWFMAVKVSTSATAFGRFLSCRLPAADFNSVQTCIPAYVVVSGTVTVNGGRNNQLPTYISGLANGADVVLSSVFGLSRFDLWADGVAGGGHATGGAFNFGLLDYGSGGFSEKANGMIAEIFALTGTVDAARRLNAENYLRTKYR